MRYMYCLVEHFPSGPLVYVNTTGGPGSVIVRLTLINCMRRYQWARLCAPLVGFTWHSRWFHGLTRCLHAAARESSKTRYRNAAGAQAAIPGRTIGAGAQAAQIQVTKALATRAQAPRPLAARAKSPYRNESPGADKHRQGRRQPLPAAATSTCCCLYCEFLQQQRTGAIERELIGESEPLQASDLQLSCRATKAGIHRGSNAAIH